METKAASIEQFRKGDNLARTIEDVAGEAANAAEMKAAATGNELIFTQVKLKAELKKMEGIYSNFVRSQHQLESRISRLEQAPAYAAKEIARFHKEIELRDKNTTKTPVFAAGGQIYGEKQRELLLKAVASAMKKAAISREPQKVGQYRGFDIQVEASKDGCQFIAEGRAGFYQPGTPHYPADGKFDINGFLHRLDNFMGKFESFIEETKETEKRQAQELVVAKASRGQTFPQMELLEALREDNSQVMAELRLAQKSPAYKSDWQPKSWNLSKKKTTMVPNEPSPTGGDDRWKCIAV